MTMFNPPHPGLLIADILAHGNLTIGNSVSALARHLGVTRATLSRVVHGHASVSAEMALKLQDALGVDAEMWLALQSKRDLWVASQNKQQSLSCLVVEEAA